MAVIIADREIIYFFQVTKKVAKKSLGDTIDCVPLIPPQLFIVENGYRMVTA